jgi:hypothetical protein
LDEDGCTLKVFMNQRTLDWLCSWPLLQQAALDEARVSFCGLRYAAQEPLVPATLRRLLRRLQPTSVFLDSFGSQPDNEHLLRTLTESSRLSMLESEGASMEDSDLLSNLGHLTSLQWLFVVFDDPDRSVLPVSALTSLAPLTALQNFSIVGSVTLSGLTPLAALPSLTSIMVPLADSSRLFGPLPPLLERLNLSFPAPQGPGVLIGQARVRPLSLECPALGPSLGAAATSLSTLIIHIGLEDEEEEGAEDSMFYFNTTRMTIPCFFPKLDGFYMYLGKLGEGAGTGNSADLVALLEAAPGLRKIILGGIGGLSMATILWLETHWPGYNKTTFAERLILRM